MTLTDGKTTVEINKYEMEILLDGLHDRRFHEGMQEDSSPDSPLEVLIYKLESLEF